MRSAEPTYRRFTVPDVLSADECLTLCSAGPFRPVGVQRESGAAEAETSRTSTGVQLAHGTNTDWVVDRLHPHILRLNQTFRFDISGYGAPQVLRYEAGQHYSWHVDMGRDDIATRKLSIIVLLSDADAYDGGDLEWMPDLGPCSRDKGTVVVFPSFMPHRVTPVVSGVRHALVLWVHGDEPFR